MTGSAPGDISGTTSVPAGIDITRPWIWLAAGLLVWLMILGLFAAFPQFDLMAAHAFFTVANCDQTTTSNAVCGVFGLSRMPLLIAIRMALYYLPHVLAVILLVLVLRAMVQRGHPDFVRRGWILLASVIAGPVLLVNGLLKTFSGRPRPYDVLDFGGQFHFVSAGDFSGACVRNCSFISGEASGAGWVFCLIILAAPSLRLKIGVPLFLLSIFATLLRVAFGGHFLSDALLGWVSSVVVTLVCASVIGWPRRTSA